MLRGPPFTWNFSVPSSNSRPFWRCTYQSYIARQRTVTGWRRRAHLPRWKLPRYALDHSIGIDSGWQRRQERDTCVVLYVREPDVRRSAQRSRVRPDESKNWSVQKNTGKQTKTHCIGESGGLLRVKDCSSIKRDQTRSSFRILYLRFAARRWNRLSESKDCKIYLLQKGHLHHSSRIQGIWHHLLSNWDQVTPGIPWDMEKDWEENRRVQENRLLDGPGILRPGILCIIL